ncbi:unnamed protein product [Caretta caretta]
MGLHKCQVLSFLWEGGYSVVFLQETHMDPVTEDSWRLEWEGRVYFSHLTVRTAGVATLFSPDLQPKMLRVTEAVPGRLLHLRALMDGLMVNLINVYVLTSGPEQLHFYQQASAFLDTLDPHECLVLGGDFKTTLEEQDRAVPDPHGRPPGDSRTSLPGGHVTRPPPGQHLDVHLCPGGAHWSRHARLDRIYLSRFHLSRAHSSNIQLAPFSDHH